MEFDPNNPVVQLCVKGMNAEGEGKIEEAHQLFQQAWDMAANDFEAFTAAHYLARNQVDPNDNLKWNLVALTRASTIKGETTKGHYPSLYLNVAKSYETLGNNEEAVRYYRLAADSCEHLPAGKYADMIRSGVSAGLKRVGETTFNDDQITQLVNNWCERKELKPLSMILPAYVGNLGTENDRNKLLSAFSYLSAMRCLSEEEQRTVEAIVAKLSADVSE
jgi:tetratricopeptide (TPR) repeat protein